MEAPDFWDDAEVSQKKMKELKDMKDDMETYQNLVTQMEDMETMIEMGYEENDPALIPEIQEMLDEFQKDFDNIRIKTLLSGEYDSENAIIKLNAGAGGTEACDWCGMLYRMYSRWVDRKGFTMEVLDYLEGDVAGIKGVTFGGAWVVTVCCLTVCACINGCVCIGTVCCTCVGLTGACC